jgi:hypothetical protein
VGKGLDLRDGEALRPNTLDPFPQYDGYLVWKRLVETYFSTKLTKARDKLVAISALAKEIRQGLKDDYLAGLWRRHLGWELGWRASEDGSNVRPSEYRCPSWSWASIDGQVYTTDYGENQYLLLHVLEARITPLGDDDTGEVADGFVRVQGSLYTIFLVPKDNPEGEDDRYDSFLSDRTTGGEILRKLVISVTFDVNDNNTLNAAEKYYCLLHHNPGNSPWTDLDNDEDYFSIALLLKYNGITKNYNRVGRVQLLTFEKEDSDNDDRSLSVRIPLDSESVTDVDIRVSDDELNGEGHILVDESQQGASCSDPV